MQQFRTLFTLILICSSVLIAGVTGKIVGYVTDGETGDPLQGVNIYLQGTTIGTATDAGGDYLILNVPPGIYRLTASMIGYGIGNVENVEVSIDLTTTININLYIEALEAAGVTVIAERPLLKGDEVTSRHTISGADMDIQPIDDFREVARNQAGVVGNHFRGGRTNEVLILVDGLPLRDQAGIYSGDLGGFTANIPEYAIQELVVTLGGFGAEYGNVQSGILNIALKEGSNKFHGRYRFTTTDLGKSLNESLMNKRDFWGGTYHTVEEYDTTYSGTDTTFYTTSHDTMVYGNKYQPKLLNIHQFSLSGPLPLSSSFSLSAEITDKPQGYFLNQQSYNQTFQGKLTFHLSPKIKLAVGGIFSNSDWDQFYFPAAKYGPAPDYPVNEYFELQSESSDTLHHYVYVNDPQNFDALQGDISDTLGLFGEDTIRAVKTYYVGGMQEYLWDRHKENKTSYLVWTHALSERTFYEVRLQTSYSNYHYATRDVEDRDIDGDTDEDLIWDITEDGPHPTYRERESNYWWIKGDDPGHRDQSSWSQTFKTDLVSQVTNNHMLKGGVELGLHRTKVENISWTLNLGAVRRDIWDENSIDIGAYLQDKIEFPGIIALIGLRYDRFDPNGWDDPIYYPADYEYPYSEVDSNDVPILIDPAKPTVKQQLSPRIGISHPITDRDVLHFTYGHYFQRPDAYFLYRNHRIQSLTKVGNYVGNPNVKPEKTVSYDFGVEHLFTDDIKGSITGYYKDVTNLMDWYKYVGRSLQGTELNVYTNIDYGNIKGLEFALEKRIGKIWGGSINYTYSVAKGRSSSYGEGAGTFSAAKKMSILNFDQTHTMNANITVITPRESIFRFQMGRLKPLADWRANFQISYGSGLPYTSYNSDINNDARLPEKITVDMRLNKKIELPKELSVDIFIDVLNLFNRENVDWIGNSKHYEDTNDYTVVRKEFTGHYVKNPQALGEERQFRLGLAVQF